MERVSRVSVWLLSVLLMGSTLVACTLDETQEEPFGDDGETARQAVFDDPAAFIDEQVVITGIVDTVLAEGVFTVTGTEGQTEQRLLVAAETAEVIPTELEEGDLVRLVGRVLPFNVTEVEDQLGIGLQDSVFADYVDRPALIAWEIVELNS